MVAMILRWLCVALLMTHLCSALSLEEKVGQLLMVHFHGEVGNEEARSLIQDVGVGGIIYYNWANGLISPQQVRALSGSLQEMATIPLLIAIDQEGGRVSRLKQGFTPFPSQRELGEIGDLALIEEKAYQMGNEARLVGVNLLLGPVVDVAPSLGSYMWERSYGSHAEKVIACARAALRGFSRAGVGTILKHYPGMGSASSDPHTGLPVAPRLEEDLAPFLELLPLAGGVMTAHLLVPDWDEENCATLSAKILRLVQEHLVISDSLVMQGVLGGLSTEEVAIRALLAGCDVLLLGGKLLMAAGEEITCEGVSQVQRALVAAVRAGRIPEERIDQAVAKVMRLKILIFCNET